MNRRTRTILYIAGSVLLVLFLLFGVDWDFVVLKATKAFEGILNLLIMAIVVVLAWKWIKKGF